MKSFFQRNLNLGYTGLTVLVKNDSMRGNFKSQQQTIVIIQKIKYTTNETSIFHIKIHSRNAKKLYH